MDIQKLLRTQTLAYLEEHHGVKARICGHKVCLNYSQLEAKDSDPISQQCRGLVVAPVPFREVIDPSLPLGETVVLARPFDRFFNLGQASAAEVDLASDLTRFYEKLDGTLAILYFDPFGGAWHVGTRSVPEADLPIDGFGDYTFRTLFERACLETTGLDFATFTDGLAQDITYIFELTTPVNRIVVDYDKYGIWLLGARQNVSGQEFDPTALADSLRVPHAPMYRFGNIREMVDFVSSRNPQNHEGIVVCDSHYRRVKVKSPAYLALNKVRDSVMNSPRGLVELILLDKLDDALPLFPEHIQARGLALRESLGDLARTIHQAWLECSQEADKALQGPGEGLDSQSRQKAHRKAFALAVQARQGAWMAPLMDQYQGRSEGFLGWALSKRGVDGGWSNGFLDSILDQVIT